MASIALILFTRKRSSPHSVCSSKNILWIICTCCCFHTMEMPATLYTMVSRTYAYVSALLHFDIHVWRCASTHNRESLSHQFSVFKGRWVPVAGVLKQCWISDTPLSKPRVTNNATNISVTRPRFVNWLIGHAANVKVGYIVAWNVSNEVVLCDYLLGLLTHWPLGVMVVILNVSYRNTCCGLCLGTRWIICSQTNWIL